MEEKTTVDIVRAVAIFVGVVFSSVTLWMGHQVSELTAQMARLTAVTEAQLRGIDYNNSRIEKVESELAKRAAPVGQINDLLVRLRELEKAVKQSSE